MDGDTGASIFHSFRVLVANTHNVRSKERDKTTQKYAVSILPNNLTLWRDYSFHHNHSQTCVFNEK